MASVLPLRPARILVVEDEFLIRFTLVEALIQEGFDVIGAESGDEALPVLQRDGTIGLLLTDIQMPGELNGRQLADRARQIRPDLPVLFMTGQADPAVDRHATPLDRHIMKPHTLRDVCEAVRRLMQTGS